MLSAMALRDRNYPEARWGPALDWSWFPEMERPALARDVLCLSQWRIDNIPTLTQEQFSTRLGAPSDVFEETLEVLREETLRQTGEPGGPLVFVHFRGERYAIGQSGVHITPVVEPQDVRIVAAQPAPDGEPENVSEEWVEISNVGTIAHNLTGWHLAGPNATFNFPEFTLGPDSTMTVRTGEGTDSETMLYMNRSEIAWRSGEFVSLWDQDGALVSMFRLD